MEVLGVSKADLARALHGTVKQSTLYAFFKGAPLNAAALGEVFDALGLGVYPHEAVSQSIRDDEAATVNTELKWKAEAPAREQAEREKLEARAREELAECERLLTEVEAMRLAGDKHKHREALQRLEYARIPWSGVEHYRAVLKFLKPVMELDYDQRRHGTTQKFHYAMYMLDQIEPRPASDVTEFRKRMALRRKNAPPK